jgi:enamine deaminase RidA (YjgF/YER057c/UK114 family)
MPFLSTRPDAARSAFGSDIVVAGGWGFVSNLLPIDLANDRTPLPEGVERQVKQVFANLDALLAHTSMTRDNVVSVSVHLTELPRLYERMNAAYAGYFAADRLPVRKIVGVAHLVRGAQVMMDFVLCEAKP